MMRDLMLVCVGINLMNVLYSALLGAGGAAIVSAFMLGFCGYVAYTTKRGP